MLVDGNPSQFWRISNGTWLYGADFSEAGNLLQLQKSCPRCPLPHSRVKGSWIPFILEICMLVCEPAPRSRVCGMVMAYLVPVLQLSKLVCICVLLTYLACGVYYLYTNKWHTSHYHWNYCQYWNWNIGCFHTIAVIFVNHLIMRLEKLRSSIAQVYLLEDNNPTFYQ